ncbi:MAG: trypsin-like peptidase domain-containing protein [Sedimentisphaerales bacterium]|nr:trypsin-like peptidase domain-containing protein [Sedimentisphaerales bacterium]
MGLKIRFQDGEFAGKELEFGDDIEQIVLGRDPAKCQVVFPPDNRYVSREHCAIRRKLGRYYLHITEDRLVLLNGMPAEHGDKLPPRGIMQLGSEGPRIEIERTGQAAEQQLAATLADSDPKRQPGMKTRLAQAERRAKWGTRIALFVAILAIAAVIVIWHLVAIAPEPPIDKQQRLQEATNAIAPSVYLVITRRGDKHESPQATAWVVGDGVLATNAHVAELFYIAQQTDAQLLVRSCEDQPRSFTVNRVQIHPGYAAFENLWSRHMPQQEGGTFTPVDAPPTACDVALMWVDNPEGLNPPLPLATADQVQHLTAGEPLALVGYPMENMAMMGGRPLYPAPVTQFGAVTRVTTHFNVDLKDSSGRRLGHLIQHSIPLTGGASGSPIINAEGQVVGVCSAINMVAVFQRDESGNILRDESGMPLYDRVPSGSGVNFGERVDLLHELLEGTAEQAQAQRTARWENEIQDLYTTLPAAVVENWATALGAGYNVETLWQREGVLPQSNKRSNPATFTYEFDLPSPGLYQVLAIGADYSDVNLQVYSTGRRHTLLGSDMAQDSWPVVRFEMRQSGPIEVVILGPQPSQETQYQLQVHHAQIEQEEPQPQPQPDPDPEPDPEEPTPNRQRPPK